MDNQYDSEWFGSEPQRPFAEEQPDFPEELPFVPEEETAPEELLPEEPAPDVADDEQAFNPIEHTAVYADNRFIGGYTAPARDAYAPPVQGYASPNGYAPPVQGYGAPAQSYGAPAQSYGPPAQSYGPPVQGGYVPSAQGVYGAPQHADKTKVNKVLLVIIIVMGALLAASLFGIVAYSMMNAQSTKSDSGTGITRDITPDFTLPGSGGFGVSPTVPKETQPQAEHKESDYSDKTNKDFGGLTLENKPADAQENSSYNTESAFKAEVDAVASVLCYTEITDDGAKLGSQGSGIVISEDGFVVTNAHVVGNSKTAYAIRVVTADGKQYTAGVVGFDSRTDLAVLKLVDASGLKVATFGDSEKIELGEDLIIIGNPGGIDYQNSVTKGIVSAINRDASSKNIVKYIQTDAPINPGNSGGPAVNKYGQVVGVASAKIVDEKYEGIGFCIPSAQVKQIVDSLIRIGYVEGRVKIGISGTAVTSSEAEYYGLPRGIMVSEIAKGGPCDNTDLRENDIITAFDGKAITSFSEIYTALEEHRAGDKVKLTVYSASTEQEYEIEITLQEDK